MRPRTWTRHGASGRLGAAWVRSRTRTRNRKFVRVVEKEIKKVSVLKRFFVPGPLEVKTPIRIGVGRTKKTKNSMPQRGSQEGAKKRKIYEKNEKFRPQRGSQEGANERKIYEKNEKCKSSNGTAERRKSTKNPRKKQDSRKGRERCKTKGV